MKFAGEYILGSVYTEVRVERTVSEIRNPACIPVYVPY